MTIHVDGSPEFMKFFQRLNENDQLHKTISAIIDRIAENPSMGELIEYKRIPKTIRRKYPTVKNLLRVKVTGGWRLLYTLKGYPDEKKPSF